MARISSEAKQRYFDKVKQYKQQAEAIIAREKHLVGLLQNDDQHPAYKRLALADERMNLASYHLLLNRISVALLGIKNEAFLNDARKSCYQSVIYLEEVVSDYVDAPFSDYAEFLHQIDDVDDERRYRMMRKLGFTIQSVEEDFGDNTKWRWSFVELEGRFATVAKNVINMKTLVAGLDPRVEGYQARVSHLELVKHLLQRAADRYREKYELSTLRIDDFKLAISYLQALRRIHTLLGESKNADVIKRKIEVWRSKMEQDERSAEAK